MIKKTLVILFFATLCSALVYSCNNAAERQKQREQQKLDSARVADSIASCEKPIMDPNDPKPMALMMRQMAANADSMKAALLRNEKLDSLRYPFIRFYLAEPTDPSVLEPQFYENARLFQAVYKAIFTQEKEQKKYYNLMIGACVSCHENYCHGPLKRIRKLPL